MKFPPTYTLTPDINNLLYDCDVLKQAFELQQIPDHLLDITREQSLLKSSLYSAKIEGNPLTEETLYTHSEKIHLKEIQNLSKAYRHIQKHHYSFDLKALKTLHALAMNGIHADAGTLRIEESAIYNSAGIAIYLTPTPMNIRPLLAQWQTFVHTSTDHPLVVASVAHIWFEKIHPFLDGNGRVGRLLIQAILYSRNYTIAELIPIEEHFETYRHDYYDALGIDRQDVTHFIAFFLSSFYQKASASLQDITANRHRSSPHSNLLPRRQELVNIIADHKLVSFDFLSRRFVKISKRTLHYDLAWLVQHKIIAKLGQTKGVMYQKI